LIHISWSYTQIRDSVEHLSSRITLTACSGESGTSTEPVAGNGTNVQLESSTPEPKSVSGLRSSDVLEESIVKSLAADWNISEAEVRCLLRDHRASQLGRVASDPEVQAVFKQCGVDPAIVK